ncbi:hypothetical protein AB1Y20_012362 [Prymnesium parvum]|uniref:Thymus-specific serine protease n=1 Tax=Prymnesium parvum TaxID=97485 RepID=A0AB34IP78_PRYPA
MRSTSAWERPPRPPPLVQPPPYTLRNFTQRVDHFNFFHDRTFAQRYLLSTAYFTPGSPAPLLVFTGAEGGDVEALYASGDYGTPLAFAQSSGALLVFLECRFFGGSLPFGAASFAASAARLGLLSVEQVLADYAAILTALREEFGWTRPLVAFGGSLAGTLAALLRLASPSLVDAAWASSAPLLGYVGTGVSQFAWRAQITANYQTLGGGGCVPRVRAAFSALHGAGGAEVRDALRTCEGSYDRSWADVQGLVWSLVESAGEFCYPPSSAAIAGYCQALGAGGGEGGGWRARGLRGVLSLLRLGAPSFFSPRGNGSCLNLTAVRAKAAEGSVGWNYLACTEIVHPIGANNVTDFFPPANWSVAQTAAWCASQFGVAQPRASWIPSEFGLYHLQRFSRSHSRVLFVYGLRDPWHTQGIGLHNLSSTLPVVTIDDGSHCADMQSPSPLDTPSMILGRSRAEAILRNWLQDLQRTSTL